MAPSPASRSMTTMRKSGWARPTTTRIERSVWVQSRKPAALTGAASAKPKTGSVGERIRRRFARQVDHHGLGFGEGAHRVEAVFAADAAQLIAAIRQHIMDRAEGVDRDQAGFDPGGDAMRARHVVGP